MPTFDDSTSLGALQPRAIAEFLNSVGDPDGTSAILPSGVGQGIAPWGHRPDLMTGVRIGFVPASASSDQQIIAGSAVTCDKTLIGNRIKVTLDLFYVERYPGAGEHTIVCEFSGRNQSQGMSEEVRFALSVTARDRNGAGISGAPVFVGLEVGPDGILLEGRTVSVRNSGDDWLIDALGSNTFKNGLALVETVQPVLKPFIKLAAEAVNSAAKRQRNKQVSGFNIGLDFSDTPTTAKIALGSYIVVQGDGHSWSWGDLSLDRESNLVIVRAAGTPLKLNYMILGISLTETVQARTVRPKTKSS